MTVTLEAFVIVNAIGQEAGVELTYSAAEKTVKFLSDGGKYEYKIVKIKQRVKL